MSAPLALNACDALKLNAVMYGSFGDDPWIADPALAPLTVEMATLATACVDRSTQMPLGGVSTEIFPFGGFATLRAPLLTKADEPQVDGEPLCFGDGGEAMCVDARLPSLAMLIPYTNLALQGL